MKNTLLRLIYPACFAVMALSLSATARGENQKQISPLLVGAPPVNVNISSAGTMPEGVFFAALNASFANKNHAERGYAGSDVSSRIGFLKLRYGITDNLELAAITPYFDFSRSNPTPHPKHVRGLGDQVIGFSYALFNEFQRDPYTLRLTAALALPTGREGVRHPIGNNAWGWSLGAGYGLSLQPGLHVDTELIWNGPFERGNQEVRNGQSFQWNAQIRQAFSRFDIALESNFIRQLSANRATSSGQVNLRDGYSQWFVGPSANLAVDALGIWVGVGAFFPVYRHFDGPSPSERYRLEFKIAKVW